MKGFRAKLPEHHRPNVLPVSHRREDYDFDHSDGVWGPIRLGPINLPETFTDFPAMVWCRRHGWEKEIIPVEEVYRVEGGSYGWQCSSCASSRVKDGWTMVMAQQSLSAHKEAKKHGQDPFRLKGGSRTERREASLERQAAAETFVAGCSPTVLAAVLERLEFDRPGSLALLSDYAGRAKEKLAQGVAVSS